MDLKTELTSLLKDKTADIKALFKKFNVGVPAPVVQAAPGVPPVAAPAAPAQLQEATLEDGTVIKYNTPTLAVGSIVTVVSTEGEMPAPTGEHKLSDGTVVVIAEGGVVESVTPGAPAAPVVQAVAPAQPAPNLQPILNQMAALEQKFKVAVKEKEDLKNELESFKKEMSEDFKKFLSIMQPFLDAPSAKPIELPANKFSKGKPNSVLQSLLNS